MHALPLLLMILAAMAIAYRFYSAFIAAKVLSLDDSRQTPAIRHADGQNYHATNRWVLFGHHFAAISGAGPLIGPVLAIQFGYMPGLVWLVVGVCLAGAVQDMMVLSASLRHDGKSLAEIARSVLGKQAGILTSISILFIVIVALAGLGLVVVKALGGEEVKLPAKTFVKFDNQVGSPELDRSTSTILFPHGATIEYPSGSTSHRSESVRLRVPRNLPETDFATLNSIELPAGCVEQVRGSSWGVFTIACTIPIALFVGLYMYRIRPGRVVEASLIGASLVLAATVAGGWVPGSSFESFFSLTRENTIFSICAYGFIASVLPVWLLLCPRDYLSSFLKIGTLIVLVLGVLIANPKLEAPMVNEHFANGGGPYFSGAIFPFVFICIMCGAISGFHSLVSSGTTPKMVSKESDVRMIGYGSMLLEGLVGVIALLAAAALPQGDYWAINIDLASLEKYAPVLEKMGANVDHLPELERQVGGESLRGRTGGAVTLAVGMAQIMTSAISRFSPNINIDGVIKYWYHFAIMFESLFILTTIDTGTRIARFMLQEITGKVWKPMGKVDWLPGAIISSLIVSIMWGGLIWTGSISTIWPMFGIANQLLAGIALIVISAWLFQIGKRAYLWVTLLPLIFVSATGLTAAVRMLRDTFAPKAIAGLRTGNLADSIQGILTSGTTTFLLIVYTWLLIVTIIKLTASRPPTPS